MYKGITTSPRSHNPGNFRYLVVDVIGPERGTFEAPTKKYISEKVNGLRDPNMFTRASLVGALNAESARQTFDYQDEIIQLGTLGNAGLIVDIPTDEVIYYAWNANIASSPDNQKFAEFCEKYRGKIRDPLILLTDTREYGTGNQNSIGIRGHPDTNVSGVFLKGEWPDDQRKSLQDIVGNEIPLLDLPDLPGRFDGRSRVQAYREFYGLPDIGVLYTAYIDYEQAARNFDEKIKLGMILYSSAQLFLKELDTYTNALRAGGGDEEAQRFMERSAGDIFSSLGKIQKLVLDTTQSLEVTEATGRFGEGNSDK